MALSIYRISVDNEYEQVKTIAAQSLGGAANYCERRPDWNITGVEKLITSLQDDDSAAAILELGADVVVDAEGDVIGRHTLNQYHCECGTKWDDVWDGGCDDRCPECDLTISPFNIIDLSI